MIRFRIDIDGDESDRGYDADEVVIGSGSDNDLVLDDASVAPCHCRVERVDGGWRIVAVDEETILNGVTIGERRLHHGDRIDLGDVTLTFIDEAEAAALTPAEPLVVPDERPPDAMPETLNVKPPEPGTDAATPIPVTPTSTAAPDKTCPYCGNEIPEAATICKFCDEPFDRRARRGQRRRAGEWSLLSAKATATRGVSFRQMAEWTLDGTINENSSVSGPTTDYQWRFACETPRLSKHLGVCHQCGAPVKTTDEVCGVCHVNLDGLAGGETVTSDTSFRRKIRVRRIAAGVSFSLLALAILCYLTAFTAAGRWVLTDQRQARLRRTIERLFVRGFDADRGPMRQAEALRQQGNFDGALRIYEDLREQSLDSALAREIDAAIRFTKRCRTAHTERVMGDTLLATGRPTQALRRYLIVKQQYPDTPAADGIDEQIAAARAPISRPPSD